MGEESYSKRELDLIHSQFERLLVVADERIDDHGARIRSNEKWRYTMVGGLMAVTALVIPVLLYVVRGWVA